MSSHPVDDRRPDATVTDALPPDERLSDTPPSAPSDAAPRDRVDGNAPRSDATFGGEVGGLRDPLTSAHLAIGAHDPSLIEQNGVYYLFITGGNLSIRKSTNLRDWQGAGTVLGGAPTWVNAAIGSTPSGFWAPDVSYFAGKYHVYYAASSFGSNQSAIGLATNVTLDQQSPNYRWVDEGLVIRSTRADNWNAIDPHVILDAEGQPWMSLGSFWDGIKMRQLDAPTGKLSTTDTKLYALASRGGGAIEAPSIVFAHGYYYLLVSYDLCCKGSDSTYRTMVGRSRSITGPYLDASEKPMLTGNATQLLATTGRYHGPGGGTAMLDHGQLLYVHHYYDAQDNGRSLLQIHPLALGADDWLMVGPPLWQ